MYLFMLVSTGAGHTNMNSEEDKECRTFSAAKIYTLTGSHQVLCKSGKRRGDICEGNKAAVSSGISA